MWINDQSGSCQRCFVSLEVPKQSRKNLCSPLRLSPLQPRKKMSNEWQLNTNESFSNPILVLPPLLNTNSNIAKNFFMIWLKTSSRYYVITPTLLKNLIRSGTWDSLLVLNTLSSFSVSFCFSASLFWFYQD